MTGHDNPAEPASPVCAASEAPDSYAGYLDHAELLAVLNTMLEAERAGARITALTATQATVPAITSLMRDVQKDEARWCAMLLGWIGRLGGQPSDRTGDFYEKCLAVPDIAARAALINRGQAWVVRKLQEVLPRVRDDALHADLKAMLDSHDANMARTNAVLASAG